MKQKLVYVLLSVLSKITGKFFFYISRNKHNERGRTAICDKSGVWHAGDVFDKDDIAYGISQNGVVEPAETKLTHLILGQLKKESDKLVFFDIGANIGYYGLIAATVYKAQTYSFEPLKEYGECISVAAKLNRVEDNLKVTNVALSNKIGTETFTKCGSGSSLESNFNEGDGFEKIEVRTSTLDSLGLPTPHFIKIDVEGHEHAVLEGAQQTLSINKPILFIELCSTLHDIGRVYVNNHYLITLDIIKGHGYEIFCLRDETTLEVWNKDKSINHAGMFLCLHPEKHKYLKNILQTSYKLID